MSNTTHMLAPAKYIALIAHDNRKDDLLRWARRHRAALMRHTLYATGTTGALLATTLGLEITRLQSGPLGGDQQVGAKIAEGEINCLFFFWDPLDALPHDPDVKALLRLAVLWNIPVASNEATADFLISSPFMDQAYERALPDVTSFKQRREGGHYAPTG